MRPFPPSLISACFLFSLAAASVAPAQAGYTVVGSHRSDLMILQDEQTAFPFGKLTA